MFNRVYRAHTASGLTLVIVSFNRYTWGVGKNNNLLIIYIILLKQLQLENISTSSRSIN